MRFRNISLTSLLEIKDKERLETELMIVENYIRELEAEINYLRDKIEFMKQEDEDTYA